MDSEHFHQGQQSCGSHGVDGTVAGLMEHVNGFEVSPERMSRIDQPARSKGIGKQEVAEFVSDQRIRDSEHRHQRETNQKRQGADEQNGMGSMAAKRRERSFRTE